MALYRCVSELSPTRIRSTFLDIPLVSGTSDFVARATEFFLFFRFMDHYNREQEPIPLAWRDHILERYIQVANAGLEKHVPCSKLLDILSDSMPIPLGTFKLLPSLRNFNLQLRPFTPTPSLHATQASKFDMGQHFGHSYLMGNPWARCFSRSPSGRRSPTHLDRHS